MICQTQYCYIMFYIFSTINNYNFGDENNKNDVTHQFRLEFRLR